MNQDFENVTKRDQCWHALLIALFRHDEFALRQVYETELNEDEINYSTLRRTARALEELGFLDRKSEKAQRWSRGPLAELLITRQEVEPERIFMEYDVDEVMNDPYLKELAMTAGATAVETRVREHLVGLDEDEDGEDS